MEQFNTPVRDSSTAIVYASFTDEDGEPTVPNEATWTLTDGSKAVVNERSKVPITNLASTVAIVLTGNDLKPGAGTLGLIRILVVEGTYPSAVTGTNLPIKEAMKFKLEDLPQV